VPPQPDRRISNGTVLHVLGRKRGLVCIDKALRKATALRPSAKRRDHARRRPGHRLSRPDPRQPVTARPGNPDWRGAPRPASNLGRPHPPFLALGARVPRYDTPRGWPVACELDDFHASASASRHDCFRARAAAPLVPAGATQVLPPGPSRSRATQRSSGRPASTSTRRRTRRVTSPSQRPAPPASGEPAVTTSDHDGGARAPGRPPPNISPNISLGHGVHCCPTPAGRKSADSAACRPFASLDATPMDSG
jgi:hypothetical protein